MRTHTWKRRKVPSFSGATLMTNMAVFTGDSITQCRKVVRPPKK